MQVVETTSSRMLASDIFSEGGAEHVEERGIISAHYGMSLLAHCILAFFGASLLLDVVAFIGVTASRLASTLEFQYCSRGKRIADCISTALTTRRVLSVGLFCGCITRLFPPPSVDFS